MTSMVMGPRKRVVELLGVQLDDELFAHGHIDVLAPGRVEDSDLQPAISRFEPRRGLAVEGVEVVADHDHRAGLVAQLDDVAAANLVARDRHTPAVDRHVPVADQLAGLAATGTPPGAEGDVVEALLEHAQQVLAGHAGLAVRLLIEVAELLLHQAVDAARLLLLAQLDEVLGPLPLAGPPLLTGRVRAALDRALHRVALGALQVELHPLAAAEPADRTGVTSHQTLRRFGGRQPLCGTGVTSLMPVTSMPAFWIERIAVSRPEPGPLTTTSTLRTPCSIARRAHCSAAIWAAKGVDLREPLKPTLPADAQARTLPSWSVMVTIVLLNELLMWATPYATFFRSRLRGLLPPGLGLAISASVPSSCQPRSSSAPCGCGRWCGCAARGREGRGDGGCLGNSRSPSCA